MTKVGRFRAGGFRSPLVVEFRQVEHVTATVPARRDRVTEIVPVGNLSESPESMGAKAGSLRSNPTSRRHEPDPGTVLPNAQTVGPRSVW